MSLGWCYTLPDKGLRTAMSLAPTAEPPPLHPSRFAAWPRIIGYDAARWRGDVLRSLRERAGLSREYLACLLGRVSRTVERWEAGETAPAPEEVLVLAAIFEVEYRALFVAGGSGPTGRAA